MLVARRSFIDSDEYGEVRVIAQRTHVVEDHWLVKAHPDAWMPAPGRGRGKRTRTYTAGTGTAPRSRPPQARPSAGARSPEERTCGYGLEPWRILARSEHCEASRDWAKVGVRLSQPARLQIERVIVEGSDRDGLETGGLLLGRASTYIVEVLGASAPGPRARRGRASLTGDPDHDLAVIAEAEERGWRVVGGWHSHPSGAVTPSDGDLRYAQQFRALGMLEADQYLELIYSRSALGWQPNPWLTRAHPVAGVPDRCQPVRLV